MATSILVLWLWLAVVTPGWVRVAADAYADQLVAGVDLLARERA